MSAFAGENAYSMFKLHALPAHMVTSLVSISSHKYDGTVHTSSVNEKVQIDSQCNQLVVFKLHDLPRTTLSVLDLVMSS